MALESPADIPTAQLVPLVKLLQTMCPPAIVYDATKLGTDSGRYELAKQCGRNSVLVEFEAALARQQRQAKGD